MLFSNFASSALAVIAVLAPSALAQDDVSPQSLDIEWKNHSKTTCKDSGGPTRQYNAGDCLALHESTHALDILDKRGSCYGK